MNIRRLRIEVTTRCNLSCLHCYAARLGPISDELSNNEIFGLIDSASRNGCEQFLFTGGEPFMREDLLDMIEYCPNTIIIGTNARLIPQETIDRIETMDKEIEFRISVDGFVGHRNMRGVDSESALQTAKEIKKRDFPVIINTVITRANISELSEMYALMSNLGVDGWHIAFPFNDGRYSNHKGVLEPSVYEAVKSCRFLIKKYLREKPSFELEIINLFKSQNLSHGFYLHQLNQHPCSYNSGLISIRPQGNVSFCGLLDMVFGNTRQSSLTRILSSSAWTDFNRFTLMDLNQCADCKYLLICGGGCRASALRNNGDILASDPFACQIYPIFEEEILPMFPKELQNTFKEVTEQQPSMKS